MYEFMDVYRPWYELGPPKVGGTDYCLQENVIYCWSDSNVGYERAWWLDRDGWPAGDTEHVRNILRDRPFDREWLKEPRLKEPVNKEKIDDLVEPFR